MASTTIDKQRPSMLPLVNLLLSGAALTIGLVALTTDDAGTATVSTNRPAAQEATRSDVPEWQLLPPGPVKDAMRDDTDQPPIGERSVREDYCLNPPASGGPYPC